MKIIEIIIFEYIFGYVLQGFAYCLGIYAFCVKKIEKSKYLLSSLIFIIISYIMRLLPVSFGVHTILNLICLFLLAILYLKMPALSTIRAILVITVLLLMTELLSVYLITVILGQVKFDQLMQEDIGKAIIALPSSISFAIFTVISYFVLLSIKNKKRGANGESNS